MFYQVIFQYHATTLNLSVLRNKIIYTLRIISIQCIDDNIKKKSYPIENGSLQS